MRKIMKRGIQKRAGNKTTPRRQSPLFRALGIRVIRALPVASAVRGVLKKAGTRLKTLKTKTACSPALKPMRVTGAAADPVWTRALDIQGLLAKIPPDINREKRAELDRRWSAISSQCEQLLGREAEIEKKRAALEKELNELEAESSAMEEERVRLQAAIDDYVARVDEYERDRVQLEQELESLNARSADLQAEFDRLSSEAADIENARGSAETQEEVDSLNAWIASHNSSVNNYNSVRDAYLSDVDDYNSRYADLESRYPELERERTELEASRTDFEGRRTDLVRRSDAWTATRDSFDKDEVAPYNEDVGRWHAELEAYVSDAEDFLDSTASVEFDRPSISLRRGESAQITATVVPADIGVDFELEDSRVSVSVGAQTGSQRTITVTDLTSEQDPGSPNPTKLTLNAVVDGRTVQSVTIKLKQRFWENVRRFVKEKIRALIDGVPQTVSDAVVSGSFKMLKDLAAEGGETITPEYQAGFEKMIKEEIGDPAGKKFAEALKAMQDAAVEDNISPSQGNALISRRDPPPPWKAEINVTQAYSKLTLNINPETHLRYTVKEFIGLKLNTTYSDVKAKLETLNVDANYVSGDFSMTGGFTYRMFNPKGGTGDAGLYIGIKWKFVGPVADDPNEKMRRLAARSGKK